MFSAGSGRGPRFPWENPSGPGSLGPGGQLGPDLGTFLETTAGELKAAVEAAGGRRSPDVEAPSAADRGPDEVSEMPGGAEVLLRQRRARRAELLKEGFNVVVGVLGVFLVTGLALMGWGVDLAVASASALAAALGYGYVLGREVLADLSGVRERQQRDADWG